MFSFQSGPQPHHSSNQRHHHPHQIPKPPPLHQFPDLLLLQPLRLRLLSHQHITPSINPSLRNQRRVDIIQRKLGERHNPNRTQRGKGVDHPIRRIRAVGIVRDVAKAQAGCHSEWRAVGDTHVVDGPPLAQEQISRGEQNGGDGLHGYGEAGTCEDTSMSAIVHYRSSLENGDSLEENN